MGGLWGIIRIDGPKTIYLLFRSINPYTRIGFSNLKDEIKKPTLDKFSKNVKDLLDYMYSNYKIIIERVELHEDSVFHHLRGLFSGQNSTLNHFIEI